MSAHRYWRVSNFGGVAGTIVTIAEAWLLDAVGGSRLAPSAIAASSQFGGPSYQPSNAVDNNTATFWASAAGTPSAEWFSWDLGAAIEPGGLQFISEDTTGNRTPITGKIQYSDDNATWVDYSLFNFITAFGNTVTREHAIQGQDPNKHRYWAILDVTNAGGHYCQLAEAYLRATLGGTNHVPVASTSTPQYSGEVASKAYDGTDATWWMQDDVAGNPNAGVMFDYGYAAAAEFLPASLYVQASVGDTASRAVATGTVYYSDVSLAGPWTAFAGFAFPVAWTTDGQTQEVGFVTETAEIRANQFRAMIVARFPTEEIDVNQFRAFALINFPTEFIQANQARAEVVYRAAPEMRVNQARAMVVCRGMLARPAISPWTFNLDGHEYLVINTYIETLIYDFHAERWYVWGIGDSPMWSPQIGQNWNANLGNILAGLGGPGVTSIICGDGTTSALYFLDPELDEDYSSLGEPAKKFARIITGQLISRSVNYTSLPGVDVSASDGRTVVASDMEVTLTYSDDTGVSYNSFGSRTVIVGDYSPVLQWRSLGSYRQPGRLLRLIDYGAVRRVDDWTTTDG